MHGVGGWWFSQGSGLIRLRPKPRTMNKPGSIAPQKTEAKPYALSPKLSERSLPPPLQEVRNTIRQVLERLGLSLVVAWWFRV